MIVYIESLKDVTKKKKKKTSKTNKWIEQDLGYKVNIQNSTLFQYTISEHMGPEKNRRPFTLLKIAVVVVV